MCAKRSAYLAFIWRSWRHSLHELRNSLATAENITKVFERLVDIAFWVAMIVILFFLFGNRCAAHRHASHHMPSVLM